MAKIQELWCKPGEHFYERVPTRGRKPIACDKHRAPRLEYREALSVESLTCAAGHQWNRPSGSRGRKPAYCPTHAPQPSKVTEHRTQARKALPEATATEETLYCQEGDHEWTRERTRGKKPINCPDHSNLVTIVKAPEVTLESLRADYFIGHEDVLKIEYIDRELAKGLPLDRATYIIKTRKDIVRRLRSRKVANESSEQ